MFLLGVSLLENSDDFWETAEHDLNIVISAVKPQRWLSVTAEDVLA